MSKHTGGCHCGKIKLETDLDPMLVSMCNCGRCRTLFGAVALGAMYADEEVSVVGETKAYEFIGGSGMQVVNHFCADCGCRIYSVAESFPGMEAFVVGAFDNATSFQPKGEIFTNYKLPWLKDNGCIQESFEEAAVSERIMILLEALEDR